MNQVKTNEEIQGNKTKRSTCLIRTVNCSSSKILVISKVIKMVLIVIVLLLLLITIIIKCEGRYRNPATTETELFMAFCSILHLRCFLVPICVSGMAYPSLIMMNRGKPCR